MRHSTQMLRHGQHGRRFAQADYRCFDEAGHRIRGGNHQQVSIKDDELAEEIRIKRRKRTRREDTKEVDRLLAGIMTISCEEVTELPLQEEDREDARAGVDPGQFVTPPINPGSEVPLIVVGDVGCGKTTVSVLKLGTLMSERAEARSTRKELEAHEQQLTKKLKERGVSRRAMLRGIGSGLALPCLDAMSPSCMAKSGACGRTIDGALVALARLVVEDREVHDLFRQLASIQSRLATAIWREKRYARLIEIALAESRKILRRRRTVVDQQRAYFIRHSFMPPPAFPCLHVSTFGESAIAA